jgi:four helix bundle protein
VRGRIREVGLKINKKQFNNMSTELKRIYKTAFTFAVDLMNMYSAITDENKSKFATKQMIRYGTQIGAKIARTGGTTTRPFFFKDFSMACRRADNTRFWLKASYNAGYIPQPTFFEFEMRIESLNNRMQKYMKKVRLGKGIQKMDKLVIVDEEKLNYN